MNGLDFNSAGPQLSFECIPAKTIVPLCMQIRPGGVGEGGWFTASKSSDVMMLNCEFTVTEGLYAGRKVFQYFTLSGGQLNEKGESKGGVISRATLRAILESARGIRADDMSDAAMNKRKLNGWQDFQGLCFLARMGIAKGKDGYDDKNKIMDVITPDMKEYAQPSASTPGPASAAYAQPAPPPAAPSWAAQSQGQPAPPPPPAAGGNPVPSWARP